jgi:hypothetical protein
VGRSGGKTYLEDEDVEGSVILKLIFIKPNEEA